MKAFPREIKFALVVFVILFIVFMYMRVHSQTIPKWKGYVNDFAEVLDHASIFNMSGTIAANKDLVKIVVVTVPDLQGYTVEDFTHKLATTWGVGQKGKDNGIIILVAIKERKARIEVGYGFEGIITDSIAKRIIEQDMKPLLKKDSSGNTAWGKGLNAGVDAIIARLKNKK